MLRFKHYLKESYLIEEYSDSDFKGKIHETLTGDHLNPTGPMKHYRNEETQKLPSQIIDDGKQSFPDDFDEANSRAKGSADEIKGHLKNKHGIQEHHIKQVFWTSNKSDHQKLNHHVLGEVEKDKNAVFQDSNGNEIHRGNIHKYDTDPNSNADIMTHVVRHYDDKGKPIHPDKYDPSKGHKAVHTIHGVSLKVGASKPNLANPGIDSLDRLTGAGTGGAQEHIDEHQKKLRELGYNLGSQDKNHKRYKQQRDSKDSKENENAAEADKSKLSTLYKLSHHYTNAINNLPDHKVHHLLTTLMGAPTTHHHFKAWTQTYKPTTKTKKEPVQHVSDHIEDLHNELEKHTSGFHAVSAGQSIHIHAKPLGWKQGDPLTDAKGNPLGKRLATVGLKGGNGPTKGINGTVTSHVN